MAASEVFFITRSRRRALALLRHSEGAVGDKHPVNAALQQGARNYGPVVADGAVPN